jgi:hypothetical protein
MEPAHVVQCSGVREVVIGGLREDERLLRMVEGFFVTIQMVEHPGVLDVGGGLVDAVIGFLGKA